MKNLYLKTITAITVMGLASQASAAADSLDKTIDRAAGNIDDIPTLIRIICYIAALVFGISGVMKLKEYMDQPGKTPITGALGRLLVGALLVAIPTVLSTLVSSTTGGTTGVTVDSFDLAAEAAK